MTEEHVSQTAKEIAFGYCHCGCGGKTRIAKHTDRNRGWIRGVPIKFIRYHHNKLKPKGSESPSFKGGEVKDGNGYLRTMDINHPNCDAGGYVAKHRLIAEAALGKLLPVTAEVHHIDGSKANNTNQNLVVCQDRKYHFLLHQRQRALAACGHSDWRICNYCKKYDNPQNLFIPKSGKGSIYHNECRNKYRVMLNNARREQNER